MDRFSEVAYGLIMALSVTGSFSVGNGATRSIRLLLVGGSRERFRRACGRLLLVGTVIVRSTADGAGAMWLFVRGQIPFMKNLHSEQSVTSIDSKRAGRRPSERPVRRRPWRLHAASTESGDGRGRLRTDEEKEGR